MKARWLDSCRAIPPDWWARARSQGRSPFMEPSFLLAMEDSGSTGPDRDWHPRHLLLSTDDGEAICLALGWLRAGSDGDFSFDWGWGEAAEKAGIPFWPKLVWGIPATPSGRYGLLFGPGARGQEAALTHQALGTTLASLDSLGARTFQVLFPEDGLRPALEAAGLRPWDRQRYGLATGTFSSFDDYLGRFDTNQRRNILRERRGVEKAGIRVTTLDFRQGTDRTGGAMAQGRFADPPDSRDGPSGDDFSPQGSGGTPLAKDRPLAGASVLAEGHREPASGYRRPGTAGHSLPGATDLPLTEALADCGFSRAGDLADFIHQRYEEHNDQYGPWAAKWLEPDFFHRYLESPGSRALVFVAHGPGLVEGTREAVAMSFLVAGETTLFGRYWGTSRFMSGLHFELCYYQPIQWAINHGLAHFDPGMGGEHKARRGFGSERDGVWFWHGNSRFMAFFTRQAAALNRETGSGMEAMNLQIPFREGGDADRPRPRPLSDREADNGP